MTSQHDPDGRRRSYDYIRRDDGTWSVAAIVGTLAVVGLLFVALVSLSGDRAGDPVTPRSSGATAPTTTVPPASRPEPPTKPQ